ncbi:alpha-mannosidase [Lacticaseibacillus sp. GG6-2]
MVENQKQFLRKMNQQLEYLHGYYYRDFTSVSDLTISEDTRADKRQIPTDATWSPIAIGAQWEGRDRYYWLHFGVEVPALAADEHYVLHMNLGRTGDGNNSKYEGLMFVNGVPRQAVDSNHEDAYFDATVANQHLDVYIKMWTGLEGGGPHKIQHYVLRALCGGVINQAVVDCYDYLSNIVGVVAEMSADEPLRYRYATLLKQSFKQFVWAQLDAESITAVCHNVLAQIQAFIAAHQGEKKAYQVTAVGHTHIDVAWLWRLQHTREKVARSFSTVLELMKEYPEYVFFQSTPQDYAFLEEDYPELFKQIQARVAEGRWEANGGTWLEPDTNLPSGESLTRQFLYGGEFFKTHYNARQNVLWLPDVFGYSAAMPQIMHGFGVDNFMTTKISWNDTNRMPHDTFYWQGIDGTKVLTHFITTLETGTDFGDRTAWRYTYNGEILPKTVLGSYHVYADKAINDDLLLAYGFGDGGGGPTREEIKNIKILNQLPGVPTVVPGRVDAYFDRLNKRLQETPEPVATWRGELYLEYHRGTYTSQAKIKNWNRRAEFALRDLELRYATAAVQQQVAYPTAEIKQLWHILLRNQFHDILPGSAIHEVYEDAAKEFHQIFTGIKQLHEKLDAQLLTADANAVTLTNTLPWARQQLVPLAAAEEEAFTVISAPVDTALVEVAVPALSSVTLAADALPKTIGAPLSSVSDGEIQTPLYLLQYAEDGHLTRLYDRRLKRDLLDDQGGNVLTVYEDRPLDFNNWNIDADYPDKATVLQASTIAVTANTATHTDLTITYDYGASQLTQTIRLYAATPRIDFITTGDWQQPQELLRTAFNSTIMADSAQYDIQYGNVARPTNDNTSWDEAKFETVGHKWADLSEQDYGLALLNDCKYGYRIKDRQLSLTLIKAGIDPDTTADIGTHRFTYSLLPHAGDFRTGHVEQIATELNQPLRVTTGKRGDQLKPLVDFDQQQVALDAVKISEDGKFLIIRVHEFEGRNQPMTLKLTFAATAAYRGRLNETIADETNLLADGQIHLHMRPYEIVTLCIPYQGGVD